MIIYSVLLQLVLSYCIASANQESVEEGTDAGCGCSGTGSLERVGEKSSLLQSEMSTSFNANSEIAETVPMVFIPGGKGYIGSNKPKLARDGESPRREVTLTPYYIDQYEVSNTGINAIFNSNA